MRNIEDSEQQFRFIGGRQHYNSVRRFRADLRRRKLTAALASGEFGPAWQWGVQVQLAAHFGVSTSTICRDLKIVLAAKPAPSRCPLCGATHQRGR